MATEFGGPGECGDTSTGNKIDTPTPQQEQVDLETARTILQATVNTHVASLEATLRGHPILPSFQAT